MAEDDLILKICHIVHRSGKTSCSVSEAANKIQLSYKSQNDDDVTIQNRLYLINSNFNLTKTDIDLYLYVAYERSRKTSLFNLERSIFHQEIKWQLNYEAQYYDCTMFFLSNTNFHSPDTENHLIFGCTSKKHEDTLFRLARSI